MKILIIAFEFPPEGGGIGTYTYQIAKQLSYLSTNVTVLALTNRFGYSDATRFDKDQNFLTMRYKNCRIRLFSIFYRITS